MIARKNKLRFKFKLLFGGIALIPFLFAMIIAVSHLWNMQRADVLEHNTNTAQDAAEEIRTFIVSQLDILGDIGLAFPGFVLDKQVQEALTERILYRSNYFLELAVVDADGKETTRKHISDVISSDDLVDRSKSKEFKEVRAKGFYMGPIIIPPTKSLSERGDVWSWPFLVIGKEIRDVGGVFRGAVFARVDARILQEVVHNISIEQEGRRAYILKPDGTVIAHPDFSYVLAKKSFSEIPAIATALRNARRAQSLGTYENELGKSVLGAALPINVTFADVPNIQLSPDWTVVVEQLESVVFRPVYRLIISILSIFVAILLLAIFAATILAGRIARPIEQLHKAAKKFARGNLDYRVNVRTKDEIRDLAEQFNAMARSLSKSISEISIERNKLALVLSGITDAVIAVDTKNRVITFNKTAEELTGIKAQHALGKPVTHILELFKGEQEIPVESYCPSRPSSTEEIIFRRNNLKLVSSLKKERFVNIVVGQIEGGEGVDLGCIITLHDTSREKAIEKLKSNFVTIAAHQLRTPLSGIKWALRALLNKNSGTTKKTRRSMLQDLYAVNDRMIALVDDLLNVSRIEGNELGFDFNDVHPGDILRRAVNAYSAQAKQKHITLSLEKEPNLPMIKADANKLALAIKNIVNNAVTYTSRGGVRLRAYHNKQKKSIIVEVIDSGIGIPKEEQKRVFKKFYRGSAALLQQTEGSGLGLFIAKNIIEAHKGKIWFTSEKGRGTTFFIAIPALSNKTSKDNRTPLNSS